MGHRILVLVCQLGIACSLLPYHAAYGDTTGTAISDAHAQDNSAGQLPAAMRALSPAEVSSHALSRAVSQVRPVPDTMLPYKMTSKGSLNLHVFFPEDHEMSGKAPAAVFFFGGGWVGGSPSQFYYQSAYLAARGMVGIAADYRTKSSHGTTPFDAVEDAKSAIRWVRQHAAELGVDPDRIVAGGGSAGGHLAAATGLIAGFEDPHEDQGIRSVPNAMLLFNPVLDTTEQGYGVGKVAPRKTAISPNHHIRAGVPPTLLMHGTSDNTVPYENALAFERGMLKAGNAIVLFSVEGAGHGFFNPPIQKKAADEKHFPMTMYQVQVFLERLGYLTDAAALQK